jgi:uncharacterized protein
VWNLSAQERKWRLWLPAGSRDERRIALVLVVSDYSGGGVPRLQGAARDERRIAALFGSQGFSVTQGVLPTRSALMRELATFGRRSCAYDSAVIYSTGHGVECDGEVFLLPGDYPIGARHSAKKLRHHAIPVERMAYACNSKSANIVFFAGCRALVENTKGRLQ